MKFHESLAAHREMAGYTRDQVAKRIGVTGHAYRRWERGETKPNIDQVMACAVALGASVNNLCYGPQPDNVQTIEVALVTGQQIHLVVRGEEANDDAQRSTSYTSPVRISSRNTSEKKTKAKDKKKIKTR
tara:strand:+ start:433 stop:822 length:390 start_codon:yes stop_codon:yes gene_type:complete